MGASCNATCCSNEPELKNQADKHEVVVTKKSMKDS